MAKRVSKELEQRVIDMHLREGKTKLAIAKDVGLCEATVIAIFQRNGFPSRGYGGLGGNTKYRLSNQQLEQMVEMYAAGRSCEDIAEVIGIPWLVVNKRLRKLGVKLRPGGFRTGPDHHGWIGGRVYSEDGYVRAWVPAGSPFISMVQKGHKDSGGYCLEHRLVMAQSLGRTLTATETVHHIDGNRQNNSIENLQLRQGKHGKGSVLVCADCGSHNLKSVPIADEASN